MKRQLSKIRMSLNRLIGYFKSHIKNLRVIIISAMSIVLLMAIVVFALFMYQIMRSVVEEDYSTNAKQVVKQTTDTIESYVNNMAVMTKSICEGFRYTVDDSNLKEYLDSKMVNDIVSITMFSEDNSVYAYAPSTNILKNGITLDDQIWYETPADNSFNFSAPHVQNLYVGEYQWVITLYTSVTVDSSKYIIAVDMNFSSIGDFCSQVNIGQRGYVYLIDENGKIIYHPQQQLLYANIKAEDIDFISNEEDGEYIYDKDMVYVVDSLDNVSWRTVGISYLDDSQDTMNRILVYMLIVFLIIFVFILAIANIVARYISRPMDRIIDTMEKSQVNHFTSFVDEESYSEVKKLSNSYNDMTLRIRDLMSQIKHEQRELRKTEIRALQAQINPHFLYNTLDSILWMCEKGDNKGAAEMVASLGQLFRISLSKGKEIITLRQELMHAENYLRIQQVRYKDQFAYTVSIADELLACRVPKIIIQPFLENAIYHGFGREVDRGLIKINITKEGDKILILVEDNGVGMQQDLVDKLNAGEKVNESKSGIGAANVNSRLQMYFGKEYGINIKSVPDIGTIVEISIPLNYEEGDVID